MHDVTAIPGKTQAEIPYGILEYTALFKKPILEAWMAPGFMIAAALDALGPYGFKLDGVEAKTHAEKLNEYALVFRRFPPGVTITVGIGKLNIVADNLDWNEADQFITAAKVGIDAIVEKSKGEISAQHVALGMHIQLKTKPRHEVTAPLLSPIALKLLDGELRFPGIILQREKASIIVDGSLAYANGLFVRINREHGADISLMEIAKILRSDEQRLFDVLGLEGAL